MVYWDSERENTVGTLNIWVSTNTNDILTTNSTLIHWTTKRRLDTQYLSSLFNLPSNTDRWNDTDVQYPSVPIYKPREISTTTSHHDLNLYYAPYWSRLYLSQDTRLTDNDYLQTETWLGLNCLVIFKTLVPPALRLPIKLWKPVA